MSDYTPTTDEINSVWRSRYDSQYHWAAGEELRGYEDEFDRWLEQVKAEARAGALADAGLPARPLPTRDEIKEVLQREFGSFLAHNPANPALFWGQSADAVLALLKGQDT